MSGGDQSTRAKEWTIQFMRLRGVLPGSATIGMLVILVLAVGMRFVLLALHWPVVNADESTIDLMARHIVYQGEHPIFFYGQNYMGSLQAYLGALSIALFGSTAFSVRLGTLLIFALYLTCMYLLVRLLYTPKFALFCIALLSIGSDRMMSIPLVANGGYAETMLFGALLFLLATRLVLTKPLQRAPLNWRRLLTYAVLGCVIGLGLWSDQLILTAILTAGLFLLLCCRQEIRSLALPTVIVGFLVGAIPLILYNLSALPGQDSFHVLLGTVFSGAPRTIPFTQQVGQTFLISLPLATGMPFTAGGTHALCGTVEPYLHPIGSFTNLFPTSNPDLCIALRGGWSLVIVILWALALIGTLLLIRRQRTLRRRELPAESQTEEQWREQTRQYARLMLLGSGAIWLLLFMLSSAAMITPRASCRYLICLLLTSPAILWPLWQGICSVRTHHRRLNLIQSRFLSSLLALLLISAMYVIGTGDIFANIPANQQTYKQTNNLIQELLDRGVTRLYTDYGTCNVLIFQSNEHIICSVLDDHLQTGQNRYPLYTSLVTASAHPAYVFVATSPSAQALLHSPIGQDSLYQHVLIDGYSVYYQPLARG